MWVPHLCGEHPHCPMSAKTDPFLIKKMTMKMSKGEVAFMLLWVILAVFTFVYSFTLPLVAMILELMFSCINIVASTLFIITWIKQLKGKNNV